jgi:antitoxin VapB
LAFRFEGTQVYIKRMGSAVVLLPEHDTWQVLIASLDNFSADFMIDRKQPEQQEREALFE